MPKVAAGLADGRRRMTAAATEKDGPSIAEEHRGTDPPGLLARLRQDALRALAAGPLYRHTLIGRVAGGIEVA